VFGLPPKSDDTVVVLEVLPSAEEEDSVVVVQLFHTQHERFFPTLASALVTTINPIRKVSTAATRLRVRIERRRAGSREENLENGSLKL
jgi:hypothetical protein